MAERWTQLVSSDAFVVHCLMRSSPAPLLCSALLLCSPLCLVTLEDFLGHVQVAEEFDFFFSRFDRLLRSSLLLSES